MEVDALIVGGGPVGLMLALGLHRKGLKAIVVEKNRAVSEDWSSAYTYRIDSRGISLFDRLGLLSELMALGVPSEGFSRTNWKPDGKVEERSSNTAISLGYWIQRPRLIRVMTDALPSDVLIEGSLQALRFADTCVADVQIGGETVSIKSWLVFGCDGVRSTVRTCLQAANPSVASDFEPQVIKTPSTGLVYKAVLFKPPPFMTPGKMYSIEGKSGRSLSLLPFAGEFEEPRPVSFAQLPDHPLHSYQTSGEVYASLQEDFPQMEAEVRLPNGSAAAWCNSEGTTFPHARYCRRAIAWVGNAGVALLGDSLHCFPPDLGQGVNAGFDDVASLLSHWPSSASDKAAVKSALTAFDLDRAPEAEAICRLLPIGMPYQYNLPKSFAKFMFFSNFMVRYGTHKLLPSIIAPPVVFLVTSAPPLRYTEILRIHERNTRRLTFMASMFALAMWLIKSKVLRR